MQSSDFPHYLDSVQCAIIQLICDTAKSEISLENYRGESLFRLNTIQIKINGTVSWSSSPRGLCLNIYIVMVYFQPTFYPS